MKRILNLSLITFFTLFNQYGHASGNISVGVSEIPNLLSSQADLSGPYNKLLSKFPELDLVFAPPGRIGRLWDKMELNCLFPGSKKAMSNQENYIVSIAASSVDAYLFTLSPYTSPEQLVGKKIAIRRGFSYGKIRERFSANFIELESEKALIEFLKLERVDAVIGYYPDIEASTKLNNAKMPFYLASTPIYEVDDAFVCHNTSENQRFIDTANQIIRDWKVGSIN